MRGAMAEESDSNSSIRFVRVVLPWLLGAGMLVVYLLTLNHWVSPGSLGLITNISGLNYRAELLGPITYLMTWPFRWLPAAWIAPALNLFAAGCAALSLAWLARAVALLPHDQTDAQRLRLPGDFSSLTIRTAWLPPTLAVVICGLQLTFWEHAIVATGEMFNLLLFAWLVRCLLELRTDGNKVRLSRFALVYGLAVANNWAMAAFGPLFFLAAVWAARANPFRKRFLERVLRAFNGRNLPWFVRFRKALRPFNPRLWAAMLACLLAGLSLLLLLPLVASWPDDSQTDFWPALLLTLRIYRRLLLAFPMRVVLLLCLGSVLPALFMAIRWRSLAGGANATGKLTAGLFHFVHGLFLTACLWAALDLPLSPRRLGIGFPCLPLYYLGALSAGYFSGYFLLVFGSRPREGRRRSGLLTRLVNRGVTGAVHVAFVAALGLLLWNNLPHILWSRSGALEIYGRLLERCLPAPGAIIIGDDPFRLPCLQATLVRHGQQAAYLPLDPSLLSEGAGYLEFLRERHPEFNVEPPAFRLASDLTNLIVMVPWVQELAAARPVYDLYPIFGYLGEAFSVQPRGLFYRLNPRAANALALPPLPPEALGENRAFWQAIAAGPLAELVGRIRSPEQPARFGLWQRILREANALPEPDHSAEALGGCCSAALDAWGVELQRAGLLAEAGESFLLALQLNPANAAAQINREFNQTLQAHKPAAIPSTRQVEARFGQRRSWEEILTMDGPIDEPNACYKLGSLFAEARLPRQAIEQFARARTLAPAYPDTALRLAEQLLLLADYTNVLAAASQMLRLEPRNPDGLLLEGCSLLGLKDYEHALTPLSELLTIQTNSRASLARGIAYLELGNLDAARQDYEQAAQLLTNACPAWFGLAEVAYRQKDTAAAIKYGELFLSNAPPTLPDCRLIEARLAELRTGDDGPLKPNE
jgi:tetratricopeptide (TPR) repeat protein